ncbi:Crp/Fnr family transcriptional regulator [Xanthovirga aplysinae]|uniref:Crp/Fnr family transcriptional regulator n=1 Tax=Xanthovirga aplysinae TaxID=2529853 RepID=UPI0012BBC5C3|nr:Crp/Fnr family transcriptional regulator [Xanthovirga aplysinae]MTI32049.1 Crp/Fnr family transcriptional regulator [Xanthovirga aplysinae]
MSEESNIWFFENVDLFHLLCPSKVEDMGEKHNEHVYQKNQYIYFSDEPSDYIYMIAKGRVKIGSYSEDGKEMIKAILSEGEVFGELALTGEPIRRDFAMAMEKDTRICPMKISQMQELMANNKPLSLKIFKMIGFRIRKLERRLESLVFKDARSRVIEFIRDMAEERGKKVGVETLVKYNLTHQDIANLTGTSRQTVTTILNELKEKNIINFDRKRILIRDLDKLA